LSRKETRGGQEKKKVPSGGGGGGVFEDGGHGFYRLGKTTLGGRKKGALSLEDVENQSLAKEKNRCPCRLESLYQSKKTD